MLQYETRLYYRKDVSCPYTEWLESLDLNWQEAILKRIKRLEQGNLGDWKSIGLGIKELRFHFGQGYRVYFTFLDQRRILLLSGGSKSTQHRDIIRAQSFLQEYLNANN